MKHILVISISIFLAFAQTACAGARARQTVARDSVSSVPADYYASADAQCGSVLKVALGNITREHTVFSYGELWYHYELTDVVIGTDNQVFDYYSPRTYYFTGLGTAPAGANKEHACPQSWWGSGALCNAYTDLFNVYPSEEAANSAKSNFPLGVVSSHPTFQNRCMKTGPSARSEYKGSVFEPCDEYKGDFARIYFYVATTYADAAWGSKESVANTVAFNHEDYPTIKPWLIDLLLQWNAQDPVSDWEITRNERVCREQGNRNPFIDYPQLADHIWGDKKTVGFLFAEAELNGKATGGTGGFFPGNDDESGNGNGSDNGGGNTGTADDQPIGGENLMSKVLLDEDFSSITAGNDSDNNGSSAQWTGNDNFSVLSAAYEAGGAIRLGSGKQSGSIQSRALDNEAGASLVILLQVKGWTTVEGQLEVTLTGQPSQTLAYTHSMADGYETLELRFDNCQANATLTIATTQKRAFISAVRVGVAAEASQAVQQVAKDETSITYCNLMGQPASPAEQGLRLSASHGKTIVLF